MDQARDHTDLRELLAAFADAGGVSGHEGDVAALLAETLAPLTDEVRTDVLGNVIATRRGSGGEAEVPMPVSVTIRRQMPKVGRNEPCPCGSGRKFKHCCGK